MTVRSQNPKLHFKSLTFTGLSDGPRLIILGAVHGNETCGTHAIRRVVEELDHGRLVVERGMVTFVPVTNPLAFARGERVGDRNLNRNLQPALHPQDFEDHVANWLCPLLGSHDVLLDLHSTRARNLPFAMLGPLDNTGPLQPFSYSGQERALALRLGVHRFVDGWLDTYAKGVRRRQAIADSPDPLLADARYGVGTTEYMRSTGGYAITLECGAHDDPQAPEVAYRAIHNTLLHLGLVAGDPPEPVERVEMLHMYDVHDKVHVEDAFSRPWASFDRLVAGDLIGTRKDGTPVVAAEDGFILFPDAKADAGREWFYLARE